LPGPRKKEENMREVHKNKGLNGYDYDNDKFPYHIGSEVLDASRAEIETPGESPSVLLNNIADIIRASGGVTDRTPLPFMWALGEP